MVMVTVACRDNFGPSFFYAQPYPSPHPRHVRLSRQMLVGLLLSLSVQRHGQTDRQTETD